MVENKDLKEKVLKIEVQNFEEFDGFKEFKLKVKEFSEECKFLKEDKEFIMVKLLFLEKEVS